MVKRGRGEGDGGFNISPAQEEIGVTIQNTPTSIFLKIISLGPHLAKQYVSMVTALASVPVCNSGPTELLLIGLDILKITNPKPVTKLYGNCKADATKLC